MLRSRGACAVSRTERAASLLRAGLCAVSLAALGTAPAVAQPPPVAAARAFAGSTFGPYSAEFIAGGSALAKPLPGLDAAAPLAARAPFTLYGWVDLAECTAARCALFGLGERQAGAYLGTDDGALAFWSGASRVTARADAPRLAGGARHFVALVYDGEAARLALDGADVGGGAAATAALAPLLELAPRPPAAAADGAFAGRLASVVVVGRALDAAALRAAFENRPAFDLINYEAGSPGWSVQTRQMVGQAAPQDASTLPRSRAAFSAPRAVPAAAAVALTPLGPGAGEAARYRLGAWRLRAAPEVQAGAAAIATPRFDDRDWHAATVPGTVLGTLVDRGVYPDPDYGLNNLAIPESLNKHDWWYRAELVAPAELRGRRLLLVFDGVNYAAEVWVNGARVGDMRGAFARGRFDVTDRLRAGEPNAVAVRVSPPPDPGIPHEQSIAAGAGNNGGMLALDGPTFVAAEGWDWIPAVRDRNTGLWQEVRLESSGDVRIGDLQVVTTLPEPDNSVADVEISVPLTNLGTRAQRVTVRAAFDDVAVAKTITVEPGAASVTLRSAELPALRLRNPRLWWPNGYGEPALHALEVTAAAGGRVSDRRTTRFGMRTITYELGLFDASGHLRRVELDLAAARVRGETLVDVRHSAIRRITAERLGLWAASLAPGAERSPAVRPVADARLAQNLVLVVNGVRIAARGGNWGMDDWRKRVSRERLEPYFRLHRDAHLNTLRNWVGQSTEETFFDLADEYGLLVIDEFWASTQNFQLEPQDVPLFLANAADVIARFRNHPSIAFWNGRNEGVPQPPLNEGLAKLVHELDGTRYYSPSSLVVNFALGGPYAFRPPEFYFDYSGNGFTMEVGLPSFPTLEAFAAMVPPEDRWPIDDAWAYHDWHAAGNGDTAPFMAALAARYGVPTSLEDFERKAQLLNYETHRAAFEGMNAGLWTKNSGRLLWMSQPAWPSTVWQIMSADYDTHAAFYGVKVAGEPVHAQLNLPDHSLAVVNNTTAPLELRLRATIYALDGRVLATLERQVDAAANAVTTLAPLPLDAPLDRERALLVALELRDPRGALVSRNVYWPTREDADGRKLEALPATPVALAVTGTEDGAERHVRVSLSNTGPTPALAAKLTLLRADGSRILPAYYGDNYMTLLPGESREIEIAYPATDGASVALRGWNVVPAAIAIDPPRRP